MQSNKTKPSEFGLTYLGCHPSSPDPHALHSKESSSPFRVLNPASELKSASDVSSEYSGSIRKTQTHKHYALVTHLLLIRVLIF